MASHSKRRNSDIMKLMMSGHPVHMGEDAGASEFFVKMAGPKDSYYEGGWYKIRVILPATYPYKSPSIGFCTPILHPNVDEASGSVCLDVINQAWSPMFDLVNVFSVFLPQLLLYPNAADPLNRQAAQLLMKDPAAYQTRVKEHVKLHASRDFSMTAQQDEREDEQEDSDEMDEGAADGAQDDRQADDEELDAQDEEADCDEDDEVLSDCDDLPADEPTEQFELCH